MFFSSYKYMYMHMWSYQELLNPDLVMTLHIFNRLYRQVINVNDHTNKSTS